MNGPFSKWKTSVELQDIEFFHFFWIFFFIFHFLAYVLIKTFYKRQQQQNIPKV